MPKYFFLLSHYPPTLPSDNNKVNFYPVQRGHPIYYKSYHCKYSIMLIRCYHSRASLATQDKLFQLALSVDGWAGHISNLAGMGIRIWIPESYHSWVILIDSDIKHIPALDYIA
jgi:hypothetical protein